MKPKKQKIPDYLDKIDHLKFFDSHSLLIGATRYYIGRRTIATACFARELASSWESIPENTRFIIMKDLETAFRDDDKSRADNKSYHPLGHDCDRQSWELVRDAWTNLRLKEGK